MKADDILTVQELATYLRIHPSTIYRMLKKNTIPSFRVGSDWRFRKPAIDKWMSEQEGEPETTMARGAK